MILPITSPEYIDRKLRARRLAIIFAQGENPLGGPREDVCHIAADYYEKEYIKNLESELPCVLNGATLYGTKLAELRAKSLDVGITLTQLLSKYHPLNWVKKHETRKFI